MATRRPLIAGNWKMNKTVKEAEAFVAELRKVVAADEAVDVCIAPPAIALDRVTQTLAGSPIMVAAQNVHPEPKGAFTGEISPTMLSALGCHASLVGHSERRQLFGEDDAFLRQKVEALLEYGVQPILCLGETLEEREAGQTIERIDAQLDAALKGLTTGQASHIILAYEPVWAIGTGRTATPEQAQEVHAHIRSRLVDLFNQDTADATRILYGGSVKPSNVHALMSEPDIDGALVGGASLALDSFTQLIKFPETQSS